LLQTKHLFQNASEKNGWTIIGLPPVFTPVGELVQTVIGDNNPS
jgi:hypothetical protein